jgi:hypothetical protein
MHQCNADLTGRILAIVYSGFVGPKEVRQCLESERGLAGTVVPGFILFTDSIHLEKMECAPVLGEIMEECTKMGVGAVVELSRPQGTSG